MYSRIDGLLWILLVACLCLSLSVLFSTWNGPGAGVSLLFAFAVQYWYKVQPPPPFTLLFDRNVARCLIGHVPTGTPFYKTNERTIPKISRGVFKYPFHPTRPGSRQRGVVISVCKTWWHEGFSNQTQCLVGRVKRKLMLISSGTGAPIPRRLLSPPTFQRLLYFHCQCSRTNTPTASESFVSHVWSSH